MSARWLVAAAWLTGCAHATTTAMPPATEAEAARAERALDELRQDRLDRPRRDPALAAAAGGDIKAPGIADLSVLVKSGGLVSGLGRKAARARAQVTVEVPTLLRGQLSAAQLYQATRARAHTARACYEVGLKADPKLQGELTLRYVIQGQGQVQSVALVKDGVGQGVADCLKAALLRVRFPAPRDQAEVEAEQRWRFSPPAP